MAPSSTPDPRVTIVVVVFNSADVVGDCLAAIDAHAEVIVVDNGSTDDTVATARAARPGARIIENGINMGYGVANNLGLAHVETEFGMILNPDTVPAEGCLATLLAAMDRNPGAACMAPLLRTATGEPELYVMGPGETRHMRWPEAPAGDMCTWFLMGACVLWRMSAWKRIGGFDDNFFLYNEDADLCLRTSRAGYAHIVVPGAEVVHLGGKSAPRTWRQSWLREWHMAWSELYYLAKLGETGLRALAARRALRHGLRTLLYCLLLRPGKVIGDDAKCSASFRYLMGGGAHSAAGRAFLESHPAARGGTPG